MKLKNLGLNSFVFLLLISLACYVPNFVSAQSQARLSAQGEGEFVSGENSKKESFNFQLECYDKGACTNSSMTFESSRFTVPIRGIFGGATNDYALFVIFSDTGKINCKIWHFGPIITGPKNDLFFDCTKPLGSAMSMNSTLIISH